MFGHHGLHNTVYKIRLFSTVQLHSPEMLDAAEQPPWEQVLLLVMPFGYAICGMPPDCMLAICVTVAMLYQAD